MQIYDRIDPVDKLEMRQMWSAGSGKDITSAAGRKEQIGMIDKHRWQLTSFILDITYESIINQCID